MSVRVDISAPMVGVEQDPIGTTGIPSLLVESVVQEMFARADTSALKEDVRLVLTKLGLVECAR